MVNTDKRICRMIAALLPMYGVRDVVVSPGSRNTPLVMAVNREPALKCTQIVDERSAGFIALGMGLISGRPTALICTSGSAVLNYSPAIAEAYYRRVPLIVISADRPQVWIDQDDSQAIRQQGVLANITLGGCHVDDVQPDFDYLNRVLNDTLNKATNGRKGPVHINVGLSAPLSVEEHIAVPGAESRFIEYVEPPQKISTAQSRKFALELQGKKVLVVCGFHAPDASLSRALGVLAALPDVAVVAEGVSNIHAKGVYSAPTALLSGLVEEERESLLPDVLITFGGALVSNELKQLLRSAKNMQHWCVGRNEMTIDCFHSLVRRIEVEPAGFFPRLGGAMTFSSKVSPAYITDYAQRWRTAAAKAENTSSGYMASAPWCDMTVISYILHNISSDANLQLGNGMSVRNALLHDLSRFHRVDANRGVSGIDGCMATAIGAACRYQHLTYAIIGDMSATYDIGSFAYATMAPNLRIIVMNNGGGGIFHFVETTRNIPEKNFMVKSPVPAVREMSHLYGMRYFEATDFSTLDSALREMACYEGGPCVLEVRTDGVVSAEVMRDYLSRVKKINKI